MNDDYPSVECVLCGDEVSIGESRSGPGRRPVHPECFKEEYRP